MSKRYILECIKHEKDDMGHNTPNILMYGLTMSFDMAHWIMEENKEKWDVIIIHELHSIDDDGQLSIVERREPLKTKGA